MSNAKLYSEVFEEFEKAPTREAKVAVLRSFDHPRFRYFFQLLFSKHAQFDVDIPKYRPAPEPAGLNWTYLDTEIPKMYRFVKDDPRGKVITAKKKTNLLSVVLESLHKDEAALLVKLLGKDLGIKYLNPNIVKEAFPEIELS